MHQQATNLVALHEEYDIFRRNHDIPSSVPLRLSILEATEVHTRAMFDYHTHTTQSAQHRSPKQRQRSKSVGRGLLVESKDWLDTSNVERHD